jgi:4-amino-4-deoxy-L-arabinose transferase-like glycosyltransferase
VSLPRRLVQLLVAGALLLLVSFAWIAFVELTPASQRPYVGGSLNNTELGLTFEYNGVGRVGGEQGGPGQVPAVALSTLLGRSFTTPPRHHTLSHRSRSASPHHTPPPSLYLPNGHLRNPIPFGGTTGLLRLFDPNLGDQGGWMLPFALLGMVALALSLLTAGAESQPSAGETTDAGDPETTDAGQPNSRHGMARGISTWGRRVRRDPRLAGGLVFGAWFLAEAAVLSLSKGIVHPYYISALGPGAAAMIGAGAVALVGLVRRRRRSLAAAGLVLVTLGVGSTVLVQTKLLDRAHYMHWFHPLLIVGAVLGVCALLGASVFLALRRYAAPAMALLLGVLLLAPGAYASTTWEIPVEGTFPSAGPHAAGGEGNMGVSEKTLRTDRLLLHYLATHHATRRWEVLTEASNTAASMVLLGAHVGAMAGYSATDPALDGAQFARMVALGQARYVVLGGAYSTRGGNFAIRAVPRACAEVPGAAWGQTEFTPYSLALFDCAGDMRRLTAVGALTIAQIMAAPLRDRAPTLIPPPAHSQTHARTAQSPGPQPSEEQPLRHLRAVAAAPRRRAV